MKKQIINPEEGETQWAGHETAFSRGVVVHTPAYKRVFITGIVSEADGLEAQTRDILTQIKNELSNIDGGMDDIVRVRVYMNRPEMDEETLEVVHNVRNEFFSQEHLPASTLIEIEDLVREKYKIEIDADAVIPKDDNWEVENLSGVGY